jgi:predicted RNase H-like HicB family nuclease
MKDLNYYLNLKYDTKLIGFTGAWAAAIPALPGCTAEGKTPDEAMTKLADVKKSWIDNCLKSGRTVPEP